MTERRLPFHIGAFIGLSATAYALSLAAVTMVAAQSDALVGADRAPTEQAMARLAARNDLLEADARRAGLVYQRAATAYVGMSGSLASVEALLADLARVVGAVDGAARTLPERVALPQITRKVTPVSPPTVHATSGASGA